MFDPTTLLGFHTDISLVALAIGIVVSFWLLSSRTPALWTALFLATAVLTSVTGFGLPASAILPSHVVGVVSLIVLAVALLAYYRFRLAGAWRSIYAVTAVITTYLLAFVGIAQAFAKIPALQTQSQAPFIVVQVAALIVFAALAAAAAIRFRPVPAA